MPAIFLWFLWDKGLVSNVDTYWRLPDEGGNLALPCRRLHCFGLRRQGYAKYYETVFITAHAWHFR
jgi:hypothetical protein